MRTVLRNSQVSSLVITLVALLVSCFFFFKNVLSKLEMMVRIGKLMCAGWFRAGFPDVHARIHPKWDTLPNGTFISGQMAHTGQFFVPDDLNVRVDKVSGILLARRS